MATDRPLSIGDVFTLAKIVNAAAQCARVRWLDDRGGIQEGVARCIAHDGGGFLRADEDVRDGYLHVSGVGERWLPVRDVMAMVTAGEFAVD